MKKDFANYLSACKLMAVEWAKSQGCNFDFSTIDLDNAEGFDEAVAKVIEDLKMLKILPEDAQTFNSFPKDFPSPAIPAGLEDHVRACLSIDDLPAVPQLIKRGMKEYSTINFDVDLLVPRDWFAAFSHSGSTIGENGASTGDDVASGPSDTNAES